MEGHNSVAQVWGDAPQPGERLMNKEMQVATLELFFLSSLTLFNQYLLSRNSRIIETPITPSRIVQTTCSVTDNLLKLSSSTSSPSCLCCIRPLVSRSPAVDSLLNIFLRGLVKSAWTKSFMPMQPFAFDTQTELVLMIRKSAAQDFPCFASRWAPPKPQDLLVT